MAFFQIYFTDNTLKGMGCVFIESPNKTGFLGSVSYSFGHLHAELLMKTLCKMAQVQTEWRWSEQQSFHIFPKSGRSTLTMPFCTKYAIIYPAGIWTSTTLK